MNENVKIKLDTGKVQNQLFKVSLELFELTVVMIKRIAARINRALGVTEYKW